MYLYVLSMTQNCSYQPKIVKVMHMTKETKQKHGNLGKKHTAEHIQKYRETIQNWSDEKREKTRQKHREASLGNTNMLGKKHTAETKQKQREASLGNTNMLGKKHTAETKQKQRETNLGRKRTAETRQKMREAHVRRQKMRETHVR